MAPSILERYSGGLRGKLTFIGARINVRTAQAAPVPGPAGGFPSEVTANCASNERAIGGNGAWFIPNFQYNNVTSSLNAPIAGISPVPAGGGEDNVTGIKVNGRNLSGTTRALRAYAYCVRR